MRAWTIGILVTVSVVLIAWDVWAYYGGGGEATISVVVLGFAQDHPSVPFLLGVIAGHVLWPLRLRRR